MYSDSSSYYSDSENTNERWVELIVDPTYEINEKNVYQIRRKGSRKNLALSLNDRGYLYCTINNKKWKHHRLVATQFIPNPDNKPEVDHINRVRNDNRVENFRWCTHYENMQNRNEQRGYGGKYFTFTEEIAGDCIVIEKYGNRELEGYYYDINLDQFYKKVERNKYRLLNVYRLKNGQEMMTLYDKNNVRFSFFVRKFLSEI